MIIPAYVCDALRTPFGRYGGQLSSLRADDLGAVPVAALMVRHPNVDWEEVAEVVFGCANQAGEDNRNVARMIGLLAGLPQTVPGTTLNRLCGSGIEAIAYAARAIKSGDAGLAIAGGLESMSRAPFAIAKNEAAFARRIEAADTTEGWRFTNSLMRQQYGSDSFIESAENIAREFGISRQAQDCFALASLRKAAAAMQSACFDAEITPAAVAQKRAKAKVISCDEPIFLDPLESLLMLPPIFAGGTVTPANACTMADGACALMLSCEKTAQKYSLLPRARVLAVDVAGVPPRIAGMGAAPAARKVLVQARLTLDQMDVIELHESSAAAAIAVLQDWGLQQGDARVNPNGGAIAIGHPVGASGARMAMTAINQLHRIKGRYALCALGTEAGQGIAMIVERV